MNAKKSKTGNKKGSNPKAPQKAAATTEPKDNPATIATPTPAPSPKLSALEAASVVLEETGRPMTSREMVEAMGRKGYWTSPGGKTPWATLVSAILREMKLKGQQSRFVKVGRGLFNRA